MNALRLSDEEDAILAGEMGAANAMALRVVVETARMLGARRLLPIESAHIDGCLYHGESTTVFADRLVELEAVVAVPSTLNVGALDLLHPGRVRLPTVAARMARRLMDAYVAMGCRATWTCSPYQAGHRPRFGAHVAWGESNAVAFCNSVLGARTNRYGDFLDICAAICARVPASGLHLDENRVAQWFIDLTAIPRGFREQDVFFPIFGSWLGREAGSVVVAIAGLEHANEDQLKALGAAAAATGAIGLFHVIGRTPEAPDFATAFGGRNSERTIVVEPSLLKRARASLSTVATAAGASIDAVAIGSPHLSLAELEDLHDAMRGRKCVVPIYACTGRHVVLSRPELVAALQAQDVVVVVDTCVVAAPILPEGGKVLMTNSAKFAHYSRTNTGYDVVFGTLAECVESAMLGRLVIDENDEADATLR